MQTQEASYNEHRATTKTFYLKQIFQSVNNYSKPFSVSP